jgi:hypothetical protein
VAVAIGVLKLLNMWPDHTGFDKAFDSCFYVAWHFPMAIMAFPMSFLALTGAYDLWIEGDLTKMYSAPGGFSPRNNEAAAWFACFFAVDSILVIIHGLGNKELLVHHSIFGVVLCILTWHCACPFTGVMLVAQEMSTPALNTFTLLRAYKGLESIWTQAMFLIFAICFFTFRVFLNLGVTALFILEVTRGMSGPSNLTMPLVEQLILTVAISGGAGLQLYWSKNIAKKVYGAIFGGKSARKKAE